MELWQRTHDGAFVADPYAGNGSLHTWGVAVDATLVDENGREVAMPTAFDEFTSAAKLRYQGDNPEVKSHLKILQAAMKPRRVLRDAAPSGGISSPTIGRKAVRANVREAKRIHD